MSWYFLYDFISSSPLYDILLYYIMVQYSFPLKFLCNLVMLYFHNHYQLNTFNIEIANLGI